MQELLLLVAGIGISVKILEEELEQKKCVGGDGKLCSSGTQSVIFTGRNI